MTTDESDMGDAWREYKQNRQEKRASNRGSSLQILTERGFKVETHNLGAHLVVHAKGKLYDFWPGTGLFRVRGGSRSYRGVHRLLEIIGTDDRRD